MLKVQAFVVSGFHRHVGVVADLVRDPELVGLSWAQGEASARPRQAVQYALVAATTSMSMPKMSQNYEHLFQGVRHEAQLLEVLERYREALGEVASAVDGRNEAREPPYRRMHPGDVEISVAV